MVTKQEPVSRQVTAMLDTKLKFHVTWRQVTPVVTKQEPGSRQVTAMLDTKLKFHVTRRQVTPVVTKQEPGSRQVTAMLDTKLKFHVTWRQVTPVVTKREPGRTQAACSSAHKKRNWTFKHKGEGVAPAVTKQVSGRRWVMAMLTRQKKRNFTPQGQKSHQ